MTTVAFAAVVAWAAVAQAQVPGATTVREPLEVTEAWMLAQPDGRGTTEAYVSVWNHTDQAWVITRVTCEGIGQITPHGTISDLGQVGMEPLELLRIAGRTTLRMRPGGVHLMLSDLGRPFPAERVSRGVSCSLTAEQRSPLPSGRRAPARVVRFNLSIRAGAGRQARRGGGL